MNKNLDKTTLDFHDDAEIYDAINNFDDDLKFWKKWCKKAGHNVLELCCGTGRVGIPLIKAGFDYYGIDISYPFLEAATKKTVGHRGKFVFTLDDMRSFKLEKKFDSIIIPHNALAHLYSYKDLEKCFQSVLKHLKKDGLFMLSVLNPDPRFLIRDSKKRYSFTNKTLVTKSGISFTLTENNIYDKTTQINHIKWYYKIKGKKQEIVKDLTMRMYYPQELLALLEYNGFEVVKSLGSFGEKPFKSDSSIQIIIAKRKKGKLRKFFQWKKS